MALMSWAVAPLGNIFMSDLEEGTVDDVLTLRAVLHVVRQVSGMTLGVGDLGDVSYVHS